MDPLAGSLLGRGDLVCGDADGPVVVPFDGAEEIFAAASKKHEAETRQIENIRAGRNDRAWVDATLSKLGCGVSN
ncbi:hypothetical protein BC361_29815 [Ensifer sp. LC54]|nr:hypothetical protein BC363_30410 [Ensifer sp. LC384]OCP19848.1 hypothetical protein BC361_29815 [Ensifer sp. LC54]